MCKAPNQGARTPKGSINRIRLLVLLTKKFLLILVEIPSGNVKWVVGLIIVVLVFYSVVFDFHVKHYQMIPGNLQKYVSTNRSLLQCKTLPAHFSNNMMILLFIKSYLKAR